MWLFYYFDFKRNYDDIKSKGPCILLNKNINFNKNETDNRKWKITHTVLGRRRLCFSLYKNRKLKVKLMIWSLRKKIEGIFCTAYFVRSNFFNICALSQGIVYWIHFQNIHTFTYQKTLLLLFLTYLFLFLTYLFLFLTYSFLFLTYLFLFLTYSFLLVLTIAESRQCVLHQNQNVGAS